MLDGVARKIIDPVLNRIGTQIAGLGVTANQVTLGGLICSLAAAGLITVGFYGWALIALLLSRLADGLDGAVARAGKRTDFGGYIDIVADFIFYGSIPFAFVVVNPADHGVAGTFLLLSFYVNGASFLGYAIMAEKQNMQTSSRGLKSLYFTGGLLEGTETIAFFILLCLVPAWFVPLSWIFGALCFATATARVMLSAQVFRPSD